MFFKSRKCILTVKTLVFCKIFILVFLSLLLIILARKYLKKHFKMGVQDVQEPFHSATCLKLVKHSAFIIDLGRILGPLWEGFGRLRLPHEPRSLSSKRLKRRFDASGPHKDHFGPFLEAKWYHSGPRLEAKIIFV